MSKDMVLIAGRANIPLAEDIAKILKIPLTPVDIKQFNDGESYIHILKSVRGKTVFVIQPTSPPVNDTVMELLLIIDALKRASAKEINVVVPYYGYSRQDRKTQPREPISAKVVANCIETAGANRLITFDLHVDQIPGFFDIPVDNLETHSLFAEYILDKKLNDLVVVAPDVGGAKRTRRLAKELDASIAIIDKRRPRHGESEIINIVGDVQNKPCVILDDIIDTAGTITAAARALKDNGASTVIIFATHPVFSGPAAKRLQAKHVDEVVVTNSIHIPKEKQFKSLRIISLAPILADTLQTIYEGKPMGLLFEKLHNKVEEKKKK